ncbi:MAG TPA: amidohydrolase family protein [Gemmatimonadales bacterium]|nr:amidohydrolase family protein [Gemmatimonadales bacterium]
MPRPAYLFVALVLGAAQRASSQSDAPVAFTNATVIDVDAGRTLPGMTVVVSNGRFIAVSNEGFQPPRGARIIDASGKFLIPGLWDMHVHAAFPDLDAQFLPLLVANGVTGVREMFSRLDWVDSSRARVRRGAFPGPRIVASGHILDGKPPIWPGSVAVTTAAEAKRAVDSLVRGGADFIKVYSRLSPEAFFAAAREARAKRVPFAGHVPTLVRVQDASDSGQRSIEHLTGMFTACNAREEHLLAGLAAAVQSPKGWDSAGMLSRASADVQLQEFSAERCRAVAARLVKNGTWMVPTIAVLHSTAYLDDSTLAADPRLRYIPSGFKQGWNPKADFRFRMLTPADWARRKVIYAKQLEIIRLLHDAGVRFLAGTDLANPYIYPGFSLHDELASLVAAGFTPAEALRAATLDPARYLGAADSLGSIEPGKRADLVLLDANPLDDIRNTTKIAAVVAAGRLYDREALRKLIAERDLP